VISGSASNLLKANIAELQREGNAMHIYRTLSTTIAVALITVSLPALAAGPEFGDPASTKSIRLKERLPRPIVDTAGTPDPLLVLANPSVLAPSPHTFGNVAHPDKRVSYNAEALGDYDIRLLGRALIPPDTMGAVGTTQFVQIINGGFAVFDKKTGKPLGVSSDNGFWSQLGQGATGGDPRILFNHQMNRWITIGFGANIKDLNVAVSDTSDALGTWRATRFEGLAPIAPGLQTIADYPTLAMDNNAIYIGTNNFAQAVPAGPTSYRGTSLHVLPLMDIFNPAGPSTANLKTFNTPFVSGSPLNDTTKGYAIQGVNSNESTDGTGHIVAASAFVLGALSYDILNAGTAGATQTASTLLPYTYAGNGPARQPGRAGNPPLRNIDPLDDRVSSNAYELNGKTYFVQTVTPTGTTETTLRVVVIDSNTKALVQVFDIDQDGYDIYQGSIAISDPNGTGGGRAVIAFNRSGFNATDGKIRSYARTFRIRADGTLMEMVGGDILLKESISPGYLNGNPEATGVPFGRQRWGDYAAVTLDPNDPFTFWSIGQYADQAYEVARPGYPAIPSGFSRWGQWVSAVTTPEPGSMTALFLGLAALGYRARRRTA